MVDVEENNYGTPCIFSAVAPFGQQCCWQVVVVVVVVWQQLICAGAVSAAADLVCGRPGAGASFISSFLAPKPSVSPRVSACSVAPKCVIERERKKER